MRIVLFNILFLDTINQTLLKKSPTWVGDFLEIKKPHAW
tara:strand:- start:749 stop:865 length:117 start_codon:yes stop_codon:yes gene_type:complete